MEQKENAVLEYDIIDTQYMLESQNNGNLYNQYLIRQKGDAFALPKKWNFFADEKVLEALENNPPKTMYFQMVSVPAPEQYFQKWDRDPGNGQEEGDYISARNKEGKLIPILRDEITVMVRWVNKTTPSSERADKMAIQTWNRGINRGTIVPASEADDVDLDLYDATGGGDDGSADLLDQGSGEGDVDPPANPAPPQNNGNGQQNRGNNQQFNRNNGNGRR